MCIYNLVVRIYFDSAYTNKRELEIISVTFKVHTVLCMYTLELNTWTFYTHELFWQWSKSSLEQVDVIAHIQLIVTLVY